MIINNLDIRLGDKVKIIVKYEKIKYYTNPTKLGKVISIDEEHILIQGCGIDRYVIGTFDIERWI